MLRRPSKMILWLSGLLAAAGTFSAQAAINWLNDVTLTQNETATSVSPTLFEIGNNENADDVFLGSYTLTLTGNYNFDVDSQLQGAGNVTINLTDATKTVTYYNDNNNYTGLTTVQSGILDLRTPRDGDNLGNVTIGGGANAAKVTRATTNNRELISDSATVTLKSNGTLEFVRAATGSNANNSSSENFGALVMEGGTLLHTSANTTSFTTVTSTSLTLTENSYIDLGAKMSLTFASVSSMTSGKTLLISDWDFTDDVFFTSITAGQLAQIKFDYGGKTVDAYRLPSGEVVPASTVPEASPALIFPAIGALILFREQLLRRRKKALSAS